MGAVRSLCSVVNTWPGAISCQALALNFERGVDGGASFVWHKNSFARDDLLS
jgi:hypothetical protein